MEIALSSALPRTCHWRLKESLLRNPNALSELFQLNENMVPASSILWEAHKTDFQGQCISIGSHLKKDTALQRSSLLI